MRDGLVRAVTRSWSGEPGSVPWTWALAPLAPLYAAGAGVARRRAAGSRRGLPGLRVIAIGGLTAGGSGKSSVADWLASQLLERGSVPAILLRGHGATRDGAGPYVVPDYARYPVAEASARGGDEAAAHRGTLAREIPIVTGRDRHRSARVAREGYGAEIAILDDGWEQSALAWDELWVVLDPSRPLGNGAPIPAGPLRRPASTLQEASVIVLVEDERNDVLTSDSKARMAWIRKEAPGATTLRFRRALVSISPIQTERRTSRAGADSDSGRATAAMGEAAGLVSGIGAPERLTRFARSAGISVVSHAAFPDHATWTSDQLERAAHEAARRGAKVLVTTEKDEARWPAGVRSPIPVLVLRTRLEPLDPVEAVLERARGGMASPAAFG